jgi:hypothetical protein
MRERERERERESTIKILNGSTVNTVNRITLGQTIGAIPKIRDTFSALFRRSERNGLVTMEKSKHTWTSTN